MLKDEDLEKIIEGLQNYTFEISLHALSRMDERNIAMMDIQVLIASDAIKRPQWNEKHQSWNFTGPSFNGNLFTISCVFEDDTLIVTVFWE